MIDNKIFFSNRITVDNHIGKDNYSFVESVNTKILYNFIYLENFN